MIRRCDGTDPNLIMYVNAETREKITLSPETPRNALINQEPCDCGKTFDDVRHLTVWPHLPV